MSKFPAESEPSAELSPGRAKLALQIKRLSAATDALERLRQPLGLAVIAAKACAAEAAELGAELDRLRNGDRSSLDEWLRGGAKGVRPPTSPQTLAAERRYAELVERLGAVERDLPPQKMTLEQAAANARETSAARDDAVYAAAVEAAAPLLQRMDEAAAEALRLHATVQGLHSELTRRGHQRGTSSALVAAEQLAATINRVKNRRPPAPDWAAAASLLERLATDPFAALPPSTAAQD